MNGLAPSLAETEALKGLAGMTACDIVVCPPFTPSRRFGSRNEREVGRAQILSKDTRKDHETL